LIGWTSARMPHRRISLLLSAGSASRRAERSTVSSDFSIRPTTTWAANWRTRATAREVGDDEPSLAASIVWSTRKVLSGDQQLALTHRSMPRSMMLPQRLRSGWSQTAIAGNGRWDMTDHLLDKACDLYCHGIARIDTLGPSRRLVFTIRSLESRFPDIVVVKLIITTMSCLAAGADQQTISPELLALNQGGRTDGTRTPWPTQCTRPIWW